MMSFFPIPIGNLLPPKRESSWSELDLLKSAYDDDDGKSADSQLDLK
jgi:hypothetical protein